MRAKDSTDSQSIRWDTFQQLSLRDIRTLLWLMVMFHPIWISSVYASSCKFRNEKRITFNLHGIHFGAFRNRPAPAWLWSKRRRPPSGIPSQRWCALNAMLCISPKCRSHQHSDRRNCISLYTNNDYPCWQHLAMIPWLFAAYNIQKHKSKRSALKWSCEPGIYARFLSILSRCEGKWCRRMLAEAIS